MLSKCASCGNRNLFEIVTVEPTGSAFKVNLVQCKMCGAPVGAMEYFNAGSLGTKTQELIKNNQSEINSRLSQIEYTLRQLVQVMHR